MIYRTLSYFIFCSMLMACTNTTIESSSDSENSLATRNLDFQGHRGCRGLLPENTLPAFKKALDLGVTTLEMDVVITNDKRVILSHEPWFSHEITLDPTGQPISQADERNHRIYEMTYAKTQTYDVGLKTHARFPDQIKLEATKPLLIAVIKEAEAYAAKTGRPAPFYNIETKSHPQGDGVYHPDPKEFVTLVVNVVKRLGIEERTTIQSFDRRTLQIARKMYPELKLVLLVENSDSPEQNLRELGFTPDIYSPDYALVDHSLISFAKEKGMKVIPWTVNDREKMEYLISLGVDGLITDYPNRLPARD